MRIWTLSAMFALLLGAPLDAKTLVSMSLMPPKDVASIAGNRVAGRLGVWVVAVVRESGGHLEFRWENAAALLIERGVRVIDRVSADRIVRQERKLSRWRVAGEVTMLLAFGMANLNETRSGEELFGPTGRKALIAMLPLMPRIGEALMGAAPEAVANVSELAKPELIVLENGEAGHLRVFSHPDVQYSSFYTEVP